MTIHPIRPAAGAVEDTDLERRVLAHERILQALSADIAEAEARFVSRLSALDSEPSPEGGHEGEPADSPAYADQFVQEVLRLIERRSDREALREPAPPENGADGQAGGPAAGSVTNSERPVGPVVTKIEVRHQAGIWQVTRNGRFHGHYRSDQPAFDAADAAAAAIVASGGAADVLWTDARPGRAVDPVGAAARAPVGVIRTMEFRPGAHRAVARALPARSRERRGPRRPS